LRPCGGKNDQPSAGKKQGLLPVAKVSFSLCLWLCGQLVCIANRWSTFAPRLLLGLHFFANQPNGNEKETIPFRHFVRDCCTLMSAAVSPLQRMALDRDEKQQLFECLEVPSAPGEK